MMNRYALKIEYDGTTYHGWQKQKECKTIQGELEFAFSRFLGQPANVFGSGRTDSGVHALAQVAHVDLEKEWLPEKIQGALNFFLKNVPISILSVSKVCKDFHARFSAKYRIYEYKILIRRAPLTLHKNRYWHLNMTQNTQRMETGARFLIGTHDFTTFRSSICQAKSPVKTLDRILISGSSIANEQLICLEFKARSFLHNQVRSLVGSLEKVGSNRWSPEHIKFILESKDRNNCGPLAPPHGLYLKEIKYENQIF
jgi:tRNA pseudouridine38-40 synthase